MLLGRVCCRGSSYQVVETQDGRARAEMAAAAKALVVVEAVAEPVAVPLVLAVSLCRR